MSCVGLFGKLFGQPGSPRRRIAIAAVWGLFGFALVLVAAFILPSVLVSSLDGAERLNAENDIRGTLLQGLAGGLFLTTALFSWRQIQVTREGQIIDRYAKAIEMLDSKAVIVRTGGVYALQRVARDSQPDRATINEVLSAFVRGRSENERKKDNRVLIDIKGALAVLGSPDVLTRGTRPVHGPLDLAGATAPTAYLANANFRQTHFTGANLSRADLGGADLTKADLTGAKLHPLRRVAFHN